MRVPLQQIRDLAHCVLRLRPHLRGGRYLLASVVITSLLGAGLEGIGVGLLVPLLSLLISGESAKPMRPIQWLEGTFPGHGQSFYVVVFALLVWLAIVVKNFFTYSSQLLATQLRARISVNLRQSLFQRLQRADLNLFDEMTSGGLANAFFGETSRAIGALDYLLLLGQRTSMALFYLGLLFFISWELSLITIAMAVLIGATVGFLHRRLALIGSEITEANRRFSTMVVEAFNGVRITRATNAQDQVAKQFDLLNQKQAAYEVRTSRAAFLLAPIAEIAAVASAMTVIGLADYFFVRTQHMLSSYLFVFGFGLLRLLPLVNQIYSIYGQVLHLASGMKEIERLLEAPVHPKRGFGSKRFAGVQKSVVFDGISYFYKNGTKALDDVCFEIPAGKMVALVGASGSGKSTLASLLLRLRQPAAGRVAVDDTDYWEFSPESWHRAVALVEQEAFLFHDTMAQNIGYGFPAVSAGQIQAAVRIANLEDVIRHLPNGLDTIVGERGLNLSGGQRQRLAIARAIVRDPQILVLDEATSALDTLAERQVQGALDVAMAGRTVLVIAHRLSTIQNADRIVVLEKGHVIEQGSWDQLLAANGSFAHMVRVNRRALEVFA